LSVGKKKKRKKMINNETFIRSTAITANVFGLGEGGDFNRKSLIE